MALPASSAVVPVVLSLPTWPPVLCVAVGVSDVSCTNPVPAYRTEQGDVVMLERGNIAATLSLGCGRCIGCRVERARQWTLRVMHEASLYKENGSAFVTLTYDESNVPGDCSLRYRDFQLFLKRLRRRLAPRKIRFYMCGEYGEQLGRPHFHAAIFNCDFSADRYVWRDFGSGHVVYRSPLLEDAWRLGACSIGELTQESANYIARYVLKKVYGDLAAIHYQVVDPETGEVMWKVPEFTRMSNGGRTGQGGIGYSWFQKWHRDVFPHDRVVVRGRPVKPPRYYDVLYRRLDALGHADIKEQRSDAARLRWRDNTPERLKDKEIVTRARLSFKKRKLK